LSTFLWTTFLLFRPRCAYSNCCDEPACAKYTECKSASLLPKPILLFLHSVLYQVVPASAYKISIAPFVYTVTPLALLYEIKSAAHRNAHRLPASLFPGSTSFLGWLHPPLVTHIGPYEFHLQRIMRPEYVSKIFIDGSSFRRLVLRTSVQDPAPLVRIRKQSGWLNGQGCAAI
jgi:hypothetical protein